MRYIPSEKQLSEKVKLVEVKVAGEYIARIDDKRKTSKGYEIVIHVPEKFNKSDIKRATPKALNAKFPGEFVSMRTFDQVGTSKKVEKTCIRRELYTKRELERFERLRKEIAKGRAGEIATHRALGDTSDYDPKTGLPPVINDGPEEDEED